MQTHTNAKTEFEILIKMINNIDQNKMKDENFAFYAKKVGQLGNVPKVLMLAKYLRT